MSSYNPQCNSLNKHTTLQQVRIHSFFANYSLKFQNLVEVNFFKKNLNTLTPSDDYFNLIFVEDMHLPKKFSKSIISLISHREMGPN